MGGVTFHLRARLTRLARRVRRAFQRLRRLPEPAPPSFPTTRSTPEEAAEEGWSGLARVGGARRQRETGEEGNEGDYFRVRSSWFTFMPEQERGDEMGPFPAAPVILEEAAEEAVVLELEEGGGVGAPGQGPGQGPVLEMKETIQYVSARIFATSLNCGGLGRLAELGCIEEWVPKDGYDLYVTCFFFPSRVLYYSVCDPT